MKDFTRQQFNALQAAIAMQYGVTDTAHSFAIEPNKEQVLTKAIQETSGFLSKISMRTVSNQQGQKLGISSGRMIGSRTDVRAADSKGRKTKSIHSIDGQNYNCIKTDFDTHITYEELDEWAHDPKFRAIYAQALNESKAATMLTVGWNGRSAAATTDSASNPLGEDVNVGWLEKIKQGNADAYLDTAATIGTGGDFATVDNAVLAVKASLGSVQRRAPDLVAIIGDDLLDYSEDKLFSENGNTPSEKSHIKKILVSYGRLPSYSVPWFPAKGILVTRLSNLAVYTQSGSIRKRTEDNPKFDQVDEFSSANIDYVVEDLEGAAYLDSDVVTIADA